MDFIYEWDVNRGHCREYTVPSECRFTGTKHQKTDITNQVRLEVIWRKTKIRQSHLSCTAHWTHSTHWIWSVYTIVFRVLLFFNEVSLQYYLALSTLFFTFFYYSHLAFYWCTYSGSGRHHVEMVLYTKRDLFLSFVCFFLCNFVVA